ncbi:formate dehydrogenase subunit delta [Collinsella tanakaei]|nr:formate dehydrogenase subunit delta [Collinsella tanakaei]
MLTRARAIHIRRFWAPRGRAQLAMRVAYGPINLSVPVMLRLP